MRRRLLKHVPAREYGFTPREVEEMDSVDAEMLVFTVGVERRMVEAERKRLERS